MPQNFDKITQLIWTWLVFGIFVVFSRHFCDICQNKILISYLNKISNFLLLEYALWSNRNSYWGIEKAPWTKMVITFCWLMSENIWRRAYVVFVICPDWNRFHLQSCAKKCIKFRFDTQNQSYISSTLNIVAHKCSMKYKLFWQKPAHSYLSKWLCWAAFFKSLQYLGCITLNKIPAVRMLF